MVLLVGTYSLLKITFFFFFFFFIFFSLFILSTMKSRFSNADLRAITHDLQYLIGWRLSNVYDMNNRTYLLKFAKSGGYKSFIVVESGVRIHPTKYTQNKNTVPSVFALKLRRHLRAKRIEKLEQLGVDRVLRLSFGSGDYRFHLYIEFFFQGKKKKRK